MREIAGNVSYRALFVWRRNLEVFLKVWKTNFLPPLLEPFQYLLAFGLGLGGAVGILHFRGEPVSYMRFIAPGTISMAVMFWAFFECSFSSFVRMYYQRTFDAITSTPLTLEDVIAGELLFGTTKSVIAATLMLIVLSFFSLISWPGALAVIPLSIIGGLLFSAFGIWCTAKVPAIDSFNLPVFLVIFPMFVFGGTFFPVENLPAWARTFSYLLPLTHLSRLIRASTLGRLQWQDLGVAGALLAGALLLALLAMDAMKRRLIK